MRASQIARSLFTGTNYETNAPARTDSQYVGDLYYAYLQRGPDDSGLGWWTGQVASSGRTNVCNAFEGSSEFVTLVTTLYGTAASDNERTEHLVNNFYLGAYGRNATSTELQTQRDALNVAAAQGLSQVQAQAESFGRSLFAAQVNDSGISNTQFVTNLYEGFLQRGPDAGGLGFWAGEATVGTGRQNVLNAFATSGGFYGLAGTLYREAFWLVSDRLGTPRMIVGKSGSLASVKRHDYLPFGEELYAGMSGRTTTQGYTGDSTRQHFTGYEADGETGLNFAEARYQSSAQGRFTSVDPLGASASVVDPQSFNRYSYVNNNPTNLTDPSGMMTPNPAIGWIQTDDESYARTLQGNSDAKFQHEVRDQYVKGDRAPAGTEGKAGAGAARVPSAIQVEIKKIIYEKYDDPDGDAKGLRIRLLAKVKGSTYEHFNWLQTVTTTFPSLGKPANEPFLDADDGQRFYWNPREQRNYEDRGKEAGGVTIFWDQPTRPYWGKDIVWRANLSLVGIKSDGTFDILRTYSYGFSMNAKGVHLGELKRIQ